MTYLLVFIRFTFGNLVFIKFNSSTVLCVYSEFTKYVQIVLVYNLAQSAFSTFYPC